MSLAFALTPTLTPTLGGGTWGDFANNFPAFPDTGGGDLWSEQYSVGGVPYSSIFTSPVFNTPPQPTGGGFNWQSLAANLSQAAANAFRSSAAGGGGFQQPGLTAAGRDAGGNVIYRDAGGRYVYANGQPVSAALGTASQSSGLGSVLLLGGGLLLVFAFLKKG